MIEQLNENVPLSGLTNYVITQTVASGSTIAKFGVDIANTGKAIYCVKT